MKNKKNSTISLKYYIYLFPKNININMKKVI